MIWDYIVVGAGSAGCVLANRLSENPANRVLLLEAGGSDRNPLQRIPVAGVVLNYGHKTRDWRYSTLPDPSRKNRIDTWPRGKLLGGTSSLNGMIYVRGAREDFDHWGELGNTGWSYDDAVRIYQSLEDHEFADRGDAKSATYGKGGGLKVRQIKGAHKVSHAFVAACGDEGIPANPDYNAGDQFGATILSATHSGRVRYSSAQAFLAPIRNRPNLRVLTHAQTTEILFDGTKAIGVRVAEGSPDRLVDHHAREIVLAGGVFNSPQLLMLSGIGPAEHLKDKGVVVRHALPGVGQNMQDHALLTLVADVNVPTLSYRPDVALKAAFNWLLFGKGPLTAAGCEALAFIRSRPELNHPDVQLFLMPFGIRIDNGVHFVKNRITMHAYVCHPRSRGEVTLQSGRPFDPPAIQPNMVADPEDMRTLIAAGRICRQLLRAPSLARYVTEIIAPTAEVETDAEWEDFIRETIGSGQHMVGTCKMGIDPMAVVDPRLRVRGLEGLRVADASIMPTLTSGNTSASCMMIGAKAAEMMLADAR